MVECCFPEVVAWRICVDESLSTWKGLDSILPLSRYKDTRLQGYKVTRIQGYIEGYIDTGIKGSRDSRIQGYKDTGI